MMMMMITLKYHILGCGLIVQSPSLALKQLSHAVENTPENRKMSMNNIVTLWKFCNIKS